MIVNEDDEHNISKKARERKCYILHKEFWARVSTSSTFSQLAKLQVQPPVPRQRLPMQLGPSPDNVQFVQHLAQQQAMLAALQLKQGSIRQRLGVRGRLGIPYRNRLRFERGGGRYLSNTRSMRRGFGVRRASSYRSFNTSFTSPLNRRPAMSRGWFRGFRRGRGGRTTQSWGTQRQSNVNKDDLDRELDDYMSKKESELGI
ncbi:unnamed protein product [Darwinula stevensoni]|uniref:Chromatin target of PRMT1 protein C-terminal domain-containing protein n=1 Tax=Darwinula stevensoni TaxID=69355 RepID=A0A7R9A8Z2_9CRUS|nr:unnamed protein product [Darwinula stevensoni]CAG0896906.1 unnamed protein product [Darwinula stevensoni]